MISELYLGWILELMLVFSRVSALFLMTPVLNFTRLPVMVRVLLAMALSIWLVQVTGLGAGMALSPRVLNDSFLLLIVGEVLNGAAMAFGLLFAFAAFQFAGRVIDYQIGLAVANQIDPVTNAQAPLVGTVLGMMGAIYFIVSGGFGIVLTALKDNLLSYPPGQMGFFNAVEPMLVSFGMMFTLAVLLIAPIIVVLFLVDITMAFSARFMPQMNVFILSIPLKVFIGFVMLALSAVSIAPVLTRIFQEMILYWREWF